MKFIESADGSFSAAQLAAAQERELEQQKKEWELGRLRALREEEERQMRLADDDLDEKQLLTFAREDAQNQVINTSSNTQQQPSIVAKRAYNKRPRPACKRRSARITSNRSNSNNNSQAAAAAAASPSSSSTSSSEKSEESQEEEEEDESELSNSETESETETQQQQQQVGFAGGDSLDGGGESSCAEVEQEEDEGNSSSNLSQFAFASRNKNNKSPDKSILDLNSPRTTRSRGNVKINLWTLDDSPILPIKPRRGRYKSYRVKRATTTTNNDDDDDDDDEPPNSTPTKNNCTSLDTSNLLLNGSCELDDDSQEAMETTATTIDESNSSIVVVEEEGGGKSVPNETRSNNAIYSTRSSKLRNHNKTAAEFSSSNNTTAEDTENLDVNSLQNSTQQQSEPYVKCEAQRITRNNEEENSSESTTTTTSNNHVDEGLVNSVVETTSDSKAELDTMKPPPNCPTAKEENNDVRTKRRTRSYSGTLEDNGLNAKSSSSQSPAAAVAVVSLERVAKPEEQHSQVVRRLKLTRPGTPLPASNDDHQRITRRSASFVIQPPTATFTKPASPVAAQQLKKQPSVNNRITRSSKSLDSSTTATTTTTTDKDVFLLPTRRPRKSLLSSSSPKMEASLVVDNNVQSVNLFRRRPGTPLPTPELMSRVTKSQQVPAPQQEATNKPIETAEMVESSNERPQRTAKVVAMINLDTKSDSLKTSPKKSEDKGGSSSETSGSGVKRRRLSFVKTEEAAVASGSSDDKKSNRVQSTTIEKINNGPVS